MNTPQIATHPLHRLAALAFSSVLTLALLASVDLLATDYAPAAQLAHSGSTQQG